MLRQHRETMKCLRLNTILLDVRYTEDPWAFVWLRFREGPSAILEKYVTCPKTSVCLATYFDSQPIHLISKLILGKDIVSVWYVL